MISESNLNFIGSLIPNSTDIQNVQKAQIEQISEGFKSSLTAQYQILPTGVRTQCSPMYDAMIQGFDDYKEEAFDEIDKQQFQFEGMDILQAIPAVSFMSKITPIFIVFSIYAFLSVMNILVGILGGIVYNVMTKIRPVKS